MPIHRRTDPRADQRSLRAQAGAGPVAGGQRDRILTVGLAALPFNSPGSRLGLVYLSRIIDGFTGGNISTAQAYVSDVTTPENRAKGMGLLGAAFGIGFSIGPALGGIVGHWSLSL